MKVISNKYGASLSEFDKINENDKPILERLITLPPQITDTPHQKMLINNHIEANKGNTKRYLFLEDIYGFFCKKFKKVTKNLGFHMMLKTNDLQDIIYTSIADDIKITFNNLYLFVPNLIPFVEINVYQLINKLNQLMFNEASQITYKISYDDYYTKRRVISDMIVKHDIGSSQLVNNPKYLIGTHQTCIKSNTPNKIENIAIFDNLDLRKNYVKIDGKQHP